MHEPREIYASLGDKLTRALVEGDFQLYCSVIALPLETHPRGGQAYTLNTIEALKQDFDLYYSITRVHRVTDLYREKIAATFSAKNEITAHFKLHILCGARELVPPFRTTHVVQLMAEGWRLRRIISSMGHINWTLGRAEVSEGAFIDRDDDTTPN